MSIVTNIKPLITFVEDESKNGFCKGFFGNVDDWGKDTLDCWFEYTFKQSTDLVTWRRYKKSVSPALVNEVVLNLLEKNRLLSFKFQIRKLLEPGVKRYFPAISEKIFPVNAPEEALLRGLFRKAVLYNVSERKKIKRLLKDVLGLVEKRSILQKKVDFIFDQIKCYGNSYYFKISLFVCLNTKKCRDPLINLFQNKIAPQIIRLTNKHLSPKIIPVCVKLYNKQISFRSISVPLPITISLVSFIVASFTSERPFMSKVFGNFSFVMFKTKSVVEPFFAGGFNWFIKSFFFINNLNFKRRDEIIYEDRCKKAESLFVAIIMARKEIS